MGAEPPYGGDLDGGPLSRVPSDLSAQYGWTNPESCSRFGLRACSRSALGTGRQASYHWNAGQIAIDSVLLRSACFRTVAEASKISVALDVSHGVVPVVCL